MRRYVWIVGFGLIACAGGWQSGTAAPLEAGDRQRYDQLVRKRDLTDAEKRELVRLQRQQDPTPIAPDLLPQASADAGEPVTNTQRLARVTGRARRAVSLIGERPLRQRADWRRAAERAIRKATP